MRWDGMVYSPWWGLAVLLIWVLAIVAIALLIAWLVRQGTTRGPGGGGGDRALQILRERFARGEISREEFDEMRRALE
ncbi:MAG: SHOCT domain-containing protein [Sphaerobacter sp.]|nr:SHOCT domain-containing protein [Sphaerobacter sp.]